MKTKLKQIGEIILSMVVTVPICIATIVGGFALLISLGIVALIILVVILPIAIIIATVCNNKPGVTKIIVEEIDDEKELEEDM